MNLLDLCSRNKIKLMQCLRHHTVHNSVIIISESTCSSTLFVDFHLLVMLNTGCFKKTKKTQPCLGLFPSFHRCYYPGSSMEVSRPDFMGLGLVSQRSRSRPQDLKKRHWTKHSVDRRFPYTQWKTDVFHVEKYSQWTNDVFRVEKCLTRKILGLCLCLGF